MRLKIILSFLFFIIVITLLIFYWFFPFKTIDFGNLGSAGSGNYNFTLDSSRSMEMQFYKNMRYPNPEISYRIYDCPLKKKNDMEQAFNILEDKTDLVFYEANNEEISVYCEQKNRFSKDGLFIAGEGGPANISKSGEFNVITNGRILLIKESECERPNVAVHELLHALGFNHSENPNNIMYPVLDCSQTIGEEIPLLVNELYSYPSYPDLSFENVSAVMNGRYLDANMTVRNQGLSKSGNAIARILVDGEVVKELDIDPLNIGEGLSITLKNVWVSKFKTEKIIFYINSSFSELEEKNNKITLE